MSEIIAECRRCGRGYIQVPANGGTCLVCRVPLSPHGARDFDFGLYTREMATAIVASSGIRKYHAASSSRRGEDA